jgi:hypothetical protein
MIKLALVALGVVVLVVLIVVVAGARAPLRHVSRTTLVLDHDPHDVWSVVSDIGAWPSWNANVKAAHRLADRGGHPVWEIDSGGHTLPSEILETSADERGGRLVTRIADEKLPFGGTWTWEIAPPDGDLSPGASARAAARVSITEDGVIKSVVFRGVARLFLGYTRTQRAYLTALAERFGCRDPRFEQSVTFPRFG